MAVILPWKWPWGCLCWRWTAEPTDHWPQNYWNQPGKKEEKMNKLKQYLMKNFNTQMMVFKNIIFALSISECTIPSSEHSYKWHADTNLQWYWIQILHDTICGAICDTIPLWCYGWPAGIRQSRAWFLVWWHNCSAEKNQNPEHPWSETQQHSDQTGSSVNQSQLYI